MDELLTEEFTMQFDEITQKEFERFVEEVGEEILKKISATGKAKTSGKLFVGNTPLVKQETFVWYIDEQFIPVIFEALTNDYGLAPTEDRGVRFDLSIAESTATGKQAWFALRDKYSGAKTPTFTRFTFALTDYLKPHGITISCKPCRKSTEITEIKYKTVK